MKKTYKTPYGTITYWTNEIIEGRKNLVFLPGLTADHRLFAKQVEYFKDDYNILVWDAPGHCESRPFTLAFTLKDKAVWLHEILLEEGMKNPILIGQSMGGYVSQAYLQYFQGDAAGFVSIDSAPLQRHYMTAAEIWMLKNVEPIYQMYPWQRLLKDGSRGCAETPYGIGLMKLMMEGYRKKEYCRLAGHGYRMLAEAVEKELPYTIDCPAILICGEQDKAGSAKNYNVRWAEETGLPIHWIVGAGHNSNTDCPNTVNDLIDEFLVSLDE